MPPKKTDKSSTAVKNTEPKKPRAKKPKVETAKLRTPTIIKAKILPLKTLLSSCQTTKMPDKANETKASLAVKRKIELANEVALAQLTNTKVEEPAIIEKVNGTTKRGRPKSLSLKKKEANASKTAKVTTEGSNTGKPPAKKKKTLKRGPYKKREETKIKAETKTTATSKRKADSTSNTQATRKSRRNKSSNNETFVPQEIVGNSPEISTLKGKPEPDLPPNYNSPSLLEETSKLMINAETEPELHSPGKIDSRKTSSSECLSWTRDISLSSSTTCVTVASNDIVRFDKKLPIVKLANIDKEWDKIRGEREQTDWDSESDNSSSCSSESSSSSCISTSVSRSLNLSSPSIPPEDIQTNTESQTSDNKDWKCYLQELSSVLEKFDLEFTSWAGYENQNVAEMDGIQDRLLKVLTFEEEILKDCKNIKEHLRRRKNGAKDTVENNQFVTQDNVDANEYVDRSEDDDNFTSFRSKFVMLNQSCEREQDSLRTPPDKLTPNDDIMNSQREKYTSFEDTYIDDDDALSLFAESITGIESSRFNSSVNSICANVSEPDLEEYIPQPMMPREKLPETTYVPTRIAEVNDQTTQNFKTKPVCEKQNADSTSIHKETTTAPVMQRIVTKHSIRNITNENGSCSFNITIPPPSAKKKPFLLSCWHKPVPGQKSIVFKGVCFFNLISNCKRQHCTFPHILLHKDDVCSKLAILTNELFIQEYMLIRDWPGIRRVYGFCYVTECVNRNLTRVLVEMAIDFISKAKINSTEDAELKVNVIERTLLYLNDIDLSTCDDLLQYEIFADVLLCDAFMQSIAETQNFSRFKIVFMKLTDFITEIGRTFRLDDANHILERVCILPCEEHLVRAVMKIIRNTEPKIFENPMMSQFEKHLMTLADNTLCEELYSLKEKASVWQNSIAEKALSPQLIREEDPMLMMCPIREERYTSPDTTKMDNSNKTAEPPVKEPKIIRTSIFNHLFKSKTNPNTPEVENLSPTKFRSWRGHHNFLTPNLPRFRPPRPLLKRRPDSRQVAFTPPKFPRPRRPPPEFF